MRKDLSISLAAIAFLLVAAMTFQTVPQVSASAEDKSVQLTQAAVDETQENSGTTQKRLANPSSIESSKTEVHSKESIEASPVASDDRIDATTPFPIPVPLPGGIDHVAAGVGTRNRGSGVIQLRGVCPGSRPVQAFLYWGTIINSPAIPLTSNATFNGTQVTGTLIGSSAPPCWPGTAFVAYRASVIALIAPQINGDYTVSCLPSSITDGRDPWRCSPVPAPNPLSQGASLVVLFTGTTVPATSRTSLNEGAFLVNFIGVLNVNNPVPGGVPNYSILKHTRIGGDGQVGSSTFSTLPVTDERTFLGPNAGGAFTQIKGPGSPFNGDSDFNGYDADPLNKLWDTHTDSFFQQLIAPGLAAYLVRYIGNGDCFVAIVHVLTTQ